ncbi:hypothetical protein B4168_0182 [Anoxybacillus flavithermus]|nr:hypothetical protein B4168_0182 [Anoxybacillus flavithermus]OAO88901.1 hypothetical protein GT23_0141 [Parageobacillus thermoglucosidasius]
MPFAAFFSAVIVLTSTFSLRNFSVSFQLYETIWFHVNHR